MAKRCKDLWERVYEELCPDHHNVMKRTNFKDVPLKKRYVDDLIEIDLDGNIIVYGKTSEDLIFAHNVAIFYGLPFFDLKSPNYKSKLDADGRYNFECKINVQNIIKV